MDNEELPDDTQLLHNEGQQAIQQLIATNPQLVYSLIGLIHGYRELAQIAMQDIDTVDLSKSLRKKDARAYRIGVDLLNTREEWEQFRVNQFKAVGP